MRRCALDEQRKCHPSFSPHRLPRVLRVKPRPVGMLLSLSKLDSLTSPTFSSAKLIRHLPICLNSVSRETIRRVSNHPCRQWFTPIQLSHESLPNDSSAPESALRLLAHQPLRVHSLRARPLRHLPNSRLQHGETPAMQHPSLRFDFSHTNLCESIRCVLDHFDTFQTRGCSTEKRQQCPFVIEQQSFPSQTAQPSSKEGQGISIDALLWHLCRCQASSTFAFAQQNRHLGSFRSHVGIVDSNFRQLSFKNTHVL